MNLDKLCAQIGRQILPESPAERLRFEDYENLINKALHVLTSDGVFACFVFLYAQPQRLKAIKEDIILRAAELLNHIGIEIDLKKTKSPESVYEPLERLQENEGDLPQFILAEELLEKMLIYARYHAKAKVATA